MLRKKGLATVNKLICNLIKEFIIKKEYAILSDIRFKKIRFEPMVKAGKYFDPIFQELRSTIIRSKTYKILYRFKKCIPRLTRISNILKKAVNSDRIPKGLLTQALILIYSLDLLVSGLSGKKEGNLIWLASHEIKALKKHDYQRYSRLYEQEKQICRKFDEFAGKCDFLKVIKELEQGPIKPHRFKQIFPWILAILLFVSAGVLYLRISQDKPSRKEESRRKTEALRDPLFEILEKYSNEDFLYETQKEKELELLFGFNIIGEYTKQDLIFLKELFEKYHFYNELKTYGVKTIAIIKGNYEKFVQYEGKFEPEIGRIRLFSQKKAFRRTFEHEVAHARHFWLLKRHPELNTRWISIAGPYDKVTKSSGNPKYKETICSDMSFGYVRPYGGTNLYEDVATFVEFINTGDINLFFGVHDNFPVYDEKIRLLQTYGFISKEKAAQILSMINRARERSRVYRR